MKNIGAEQISNPIFFKHNFPLPELTATDQRVTAIKNLQEKIQQHPVPLACTKEQAINMMCKLFVNDTTMVPTKTIVVAKPAQVPEDTKPLIITPLMQTGIQGMNTPQQIKQLHMITQDDTSIAQSTLAQHSYNLHSCAHLIANSVVMQPTANWKCYAFANTIIQHSKTMQKVEFIPQHLCYVIINDETGKQLVFWHLIKLAKYKNVWIHSFVNELGRLKHGIHDIKGTNKIKFIPKADVLEGQSVTYRHFVIDYCPQKQEPYRTQLTMDSNRIQYKTEA